METLWYISSALLGIGLIIFIHECGHFFAAKKVGVRVERFALGFDPTVRGRPLRLFSFQRGETEYVLGLIPFGGYVKMAGEMIADTEGAEPKSDELLAKSVGARALVFVAGAVMNILSAFLFFMLAFAIGVPFVTSEIGAVSTGGQAWKAGIRPGDEIIEVNGEAPFDFYDLVLASALSSEGEAVELKYRRPAANGGTTATEGTVTVSPKRSARGLFEMGLQPAIDPVLAIDPLEETPAYKAGLRQGDKIVGATIGSQKISSPTGSGAFRYAMTWLSTKPGQPIELVVERDGATRSVTLQSEIDQNAETSRKIGVTATGSGTIVRDIAPGYAKATEAFRKGDRVLTIAGKPAPPMGGMTLLAELPATENVELKIEGADRQTRNVSVQTADLVRWTEVGAIDWSARTSKIADIPPESSFATSPLRTGDVILKVGDEFVFSSVEANSHLVPESGEPKTVSVTVEREGKLQTLDVPTGSEKTIVWDAMIPVSAVIAQSAAAQAGIEAGSVIHSFDGKPIR
ncbi:MAG: RIP metalloprotease RseP, partial [Planctomycetota bacterium]